MKTTSKPIATAKDLGHPTHHHHEADGHDHDGLNHETGIGEYVRPGLMGLVVIARLTHSARLFRSPAPSNYSEPRFD